MGIKKEDYYSMSFSYEKKTLDDETDDEMKKDF